MADPDFEDTFDAEAEDDPSPGLYGDEVNRKVPGWGPDALDYQLLVYDIVTGKWKRGNKPEVIRNSRKIYQRRKLKNFGQNFQNLYDKYASGNLPQYNAAQVNQYLVAHKDSEERKPTAKDLSGLNAAEELMKGKPKREYKQSTLSPPHTIRYSYSQG